MLYKQGSAKSILFKLHSTISNPFLKVESMSPISTASSTDILTPFFGFIMQPVAAWASNNISAVRFGINLFGEKIIKVVIFVKLCLALSNKQKIQDVDLLCKDT